jgi:squalene-hopene/tetraprenyl-beta-curcumene cyclase
MATQGPDGNWAEEPFTGTGFPKVFYLKYHMYRLYFPLTALARYTRLTSD